MRITLNTYLRILALGLAVLGLTACPAESLDGRFAPSCPAYAGDTLTIAGDTFEWDKFTDEVVIDSAGNKVDKFPRHPVTGTYSVDEEQLIFHGDAGIKPDFSYLAKSGDNLYLLTDAEFTQWTNTGTIPRCALIFQATSRN